MESVTYQTHSKGLVRVTWKREIDLRHFHTQILLYRAGDVKSFCNGGGGGGIWTISCTKMPAYVVVESGKFCLNELGTNETLSLMRLNIVFTRIERTARVLGRLTHP